MCLFHKVSSALQGIFKGVLRSILDKFKGVKMVFQGIFQRILKDISREFQESIKEGLKVFQSSRLFQGNFKEVSRKFEGISKKMDG